MKLEVGKIYKNGYGYRVKIVQKFDNPGKPFLGVSYADGKEYPNFYSYGGINFESYFFDKDSNEHLVEEYNAEKFSLSQEQSDGYLRYNNVNGDLDFIPFEDAAIYEPITAQILDKETGEALTEAMKLNGILIIENDNEKLLVKQLATELSAEIRKLINIPRAHKCEPADTGFKKTWCKHCNIDMEWGKK